MNDPTDAIDSEVIEEEKPGRRAAKSRHDVAAAPKKKAERPAKTRHDSVVFAPGDGHGNPFAIKLRPGWACYWPTAEDEARFSWRPWEMAKWGDPRIISYQAVREGNKGQPIKYREHTAYLMRVEDQAAMRAADPYRSAHQQLRSELWKKATDSGGYVRTVRTDVQI